MESQRLSVIPVIYEIIFDHIENNGFERGQARQAVDKVCMLVAEKAEKLKAQQYFCFHTAYTECTTTRKNLAEKLTIYRKKKGRSPATENMVRDTLHKARENVKNWVLAEIEQTGLQL